MQKKPWGITLNVALLAIMGAITVLALLGLTVATSMSFITDALPTWVVGMMTMVIFFTIGLIIVIWLLAYFLWDGNIYAWWILTVLLVLGIAGNLWSLMWASAFPIVALVLEFILLLGLLHKDTIRFVNPGINWKGWELEN